jgi:prohibitin 2
MNSDKQFGCGLVLAVIALGILVVAANSVTVVKPGERGVEVILGKPVDTPLGEGLTLINPIARIHKVSVRQETKRVKTACFSSDLQTVELDLSILVALPEDKVVEVFRNYKGDPFDSLVFPRVQEAIKEATATKTAEQIVKLRDEIKQRALAIAREKVGGLIAIRDLTIDNIDLSDKLEAAIEKKMVQEQAAAEAKFRKLQVEIEAQTAVERAKGEAEAIRIQGAALKENQALIELKIVEKWNGVSPLVVGEGKGANVLLPVGTALK